MGRLEFRPGLGHLVQQQQSLGRLPAARSLSVGTLSSPYSCRTTDHARPYAFFDRSRSPFHFDQSLARVGGSAAGSAGHH